MAGGGTKFGDFFFKLFSSRGFSEKKSYGSCLAIFRQSVFCLSAPNFHVDLTMLHCAQFSFELHVKSSNVCICGFVVLSIKGSGQLVGLQREGYNHFLCVHYFPGKLLYLLDGSTISLGTRLH